MDTILALGLFALIIVVLSFESGWNSLFSRDRNDLVFENKNHLYGAYSIRKNYGKYLAIAVFSTIGFATAVALSPKFLSGDGAGEDAFEVEMSAEMMTPPPTDPNEPPPPPPPPPPKIRQIQFTTIDVTTEEVDNPPPADTDLDRKNISTETTEGEDGLIIPTENTYTPVDLNTAPAKVFDFAEEKATYPGGEEAMYAELLGYIVYPEMEKTNQIEGTVYVNFVVEADGSVSNATVLRGVDEGPGFNKAALTAVNKLKKKFVPAKMNGNPVRLRMTIPMRFSLK